MVLLWFFLSTCKMYIKKHVNMDATSRDRDLFLCGKDVVNIYNHLMKGNYQLHKKDEMSVNFWYQKQRDDFFLLPKTQWRGGFFYNWNSNKMDVGGNGQDIS